MTAQNLCQYEKKFGDTVVTCDLKEAHENRLLITPNGGPPKCWWHSGLNRSELVAHNIDLIEYERQFVRDFQRKLNQDKEVVVAGVYLWAELLSIFQQSCDKPIQLIDVVIDGHLVTKPGHTYSGMELNYCRINGGIQFQGRYSQSIRLFNVNIAEALVVGRDVGCEVTATLVRARGPVIAMAEGEKGNDSSFRLHQCRIYKGIAIPRERHFSEITITRSVVRGETNICIGEGLMSIQVCKLRDPLHIQGRVENSRAELACVRAIGPVYARGIIHRLSIINETDISKLYLTSCQIGSLAVGNSTVDELHKSYSKRSMRGCQFTNSSIRKANLHTTEIKSILCQNTKIDVLNLSDCTPLDNILIENCKKIGTISLLWSEKAEKSLSTIRSLSVSNSDIGPLIADGRQFVGDTKFVDVVFSGSISFLECKFHASTLFPTNISSYHSLELTDEPMYRFLRREMSRLGSREMHGVFYALEKRCARKNDKGIQRLVSWFYDATSHYGTNAGRAFLLLCVLVALSAIVYALALSESVNPKLPIDWAIVSDGLQMSLRQTLSPFFDLRHAERGIFWQLAWILQSFLGLALIAEFLVSVRWRFKRE